MPKEVINKAKRNKIRKQTVQNKPLKLIKKDFN